MSAKQSGQHAVFGRRKEPHTVIIAHGDNIRHFTIKPWVAAFAGSALAAVAIGYLMATSYLVLRDDLIGASISRQARMQQAYEDRISALRAQVDRITSRQLLDQQLVESKVTELLQRQSQLTQRHGQLGPLVDRAEANSDGEEPTPEPRPEVKADAAGANPLLGSIGGGLGGNVLSLWSSRNEATDDETAADRADKLFLAINQSLRSIENEQVTKLTRLTEDAYTTAETITDALESAGLAMDIDDSKPAIGGPLVPLDPSAAFDAKVKELDEALSTLDEVKSAARRLPISNPAAGRAVTSTFGPRRDPLLGTLALHSGMDFRSAIGQPVRATGPGTVVHAGMNGGYGRMVEIDHGQGLTTRYAHMSRLDVSVGDVVKTGELLGASGNTGRSTGPHLHYEVRKNGEALNPLRFIKLGKKIGALLTSS